MEMSYGVIHEIGVERHMILCYKRPHDVYIYIYIYGKVWVFSITLWLLCGFPITPWMSSFMIMHAVFSDGLVSCCVVCIN
jgi:hypothetical protein